MNDHVTVEEMRSRPTKGLLAVALLILVLLLAYQLWLSYRDQVKTAEINTSNFAAIFEARLDATLRRTDADLKALSIDIPLTALNLKATPYYAREVNSSLDGRLLNTEEIAGFRVHDANGDTLYSSPREGARPVNIADRPYFRILREEADASLVFSDVLTDRSNGRQVLVIARGLHDDHGTFMGIVHAMIDLDHYRKQFQSLDLGSQGVVALRRSDNHAQVVRWPDLPGGVNQPLVKEHPVVKLMASGGRKAMLHYASAPENIERIMSIQRMQKYPFYFAVGAGLDDVLDGWRKQAMVVGVTTMLLFGLVGALLYRLRRMRVREAGILGNLAQSETQFRDLAQIVPVGICHFDISGKYTYVNDRHMTISGRSRESLMGSHWSDFVHPDDRFRLQEAWACAGYLSPAVIYECRFVRADGGLTQVLGEIQAESDSGSGKILGYIAALTDISERKQAEAELLVAKQHAESADIAKTRFLAAASHDLRQPIQAINLFRDALVRTELSEEQKTISSFLSKSVHSLDKLLYSLLDISKLDAGQVTPQLKAVLVEDLFKEMNAEFSTLAQQKNLRFKLFYPFKDIVLVTDPDLMMRVLRNLIDNALKYTVRGGVLVGFRKRGGQGVIQVWDTGIGIESCYGEKVFEECFQIGNPVRDRVKGIGLGLSIVKRTARLLAGYVSYRSCFGKGSVFEIVVPLSRESGTFCAYKAVPMRAASPGLTEDDYARFKGWRVVVIEDDLVVAKSIELSLGTLGISVNVFSNAELALSDPEIIGADFYISDFSLPGLNGLQLIDAIQKRSGASIRAVLVTGETSPERIALTAASRWKVLFKPVALSTLLAVMGDMAIAIDK